MVLTNPCKIATEHLDKHGYPYVQHQGQWVALSRVVLEEKLGRSIRPAHDCCHHCDVPSCVEAEHLYEGTRSRNMQDAAKRGRLHGWSNKFNDTHCAHGHEYTKANSYLEQGYRRCKECRRIRYKKWKSKQNG